MPGQAPSAVGLARTLGTLVTEAMRMESKSSCQRWCKFEWVGPVALEWAVRPLAAGARLVVGLQRVTKVVP